MHGLIFKPYITQKANDNHRLDILIFSAFFQAVQKQLTGIVLCPPVHILPVYHLNLYVYLGSVFDGAQDIQPCELVIIKRRQQLGIAVLQISDGILAFPL